MTQVTRWWWIRHAPVTANNGRIYGQGDPPADADGLARLSDSLDYAGWMKVMSPPRILRGSADAAP